MKGNINSKGEEFAAFDLQRFGNFIERSDRWVSLTSLDHANIIPVHRQSCRQLLLTDASGLSDFLHLLPEFLQNVPVCDSFAHQ